MDYIELLRSLIRIPSLSRQEDATASLLFERFRAEGLEPRRHGNNVWCVQGNMDISKPTLLLNSHHDTVRPSSSYTRDPYSPTLENGRLYGLGSNDAGASAVSLAEIFSRFRDKDLKYNLILAITAEEEVTGEGGMRSFLPHLTREGYHVDMALVGEPTGMQPAIAERGLVVLDCISHGVPGHAARNEGINAIYKAINDIEKLRSFKFPRESEVLGPIGIQVTQIEAGRQHNVIPEECRWVVDIRTTDAYSNEETVAILREHVEADVTPRSTRVRASVIDRDHPLVKAATLSGGTPFVSPTTSDMSQMSAFPSLKMGPGDSARSHSADEYILISEIESAIEIYSNFLNNLNTIL